MHFLQFAGFLCPLRCMTMVISDQNFIEIFTPIKSRCDDMAAAAGLVLVLSADDGQIAPLLCFSFISHYCRVPRLPFCRIPRIETSSHSVTLCQYMTPTPTSA